MLRPLGDWLVVDPEARPTQQGSIIIPDSVAGDKAPYRGTVIAAGPGRLKEGAATVLRPDVIPMFCKVGDFIIFNRYTTAEVEYGGKKYLAVRDHPKCPKWVFCNTLHFDSIAYQFSGVPKVEQISERSRP